MTIHTNGERADAPLRQDPDGNVILSLGEYRQHLIADHGYPEADVLPPERPDNLAQWRALDAKHEAARRSPCYSAAEAADRTRPSLIPRLTPDNPINATSGARLIDVTPLGSAERVFEETRWESDPGAERPVGSDRDWTIAGERLFTDRTFEDAVHEVGGWDGRMPTLPEDGSEVRISMEPDATGTPTLDVEQQPTDEQDAEPTSVLLGISRILSWYVLPAVTIGVQVATARRRPQLRGYLLTMATMGAAHTVARTIELHNSWQNRQATR